MIYANFEDIMSPKRMERYLKACRGRKRKAMMLYNHNLKLANEVYVLVNYFEVALRNAIDHEMIPRFGADWLRDAVQPGGILDSKKCHDSQKIILARYNALVADGEYTHSKLISSLEFGIWRYMFSPVQYKATGQILLKVFPNKPKSSPKMQYNNVYFFQELQYINVLRNRVAHQEPICFSHVTKLVDTRYVRFQRERILRLFGFMGINAKNLLKDMDNLLPVCNEIESIYL